MPRPCWHGSIQSKISDTWHVNPGEGMLEWHDYSSEWTTDSILSWSSSAISSPLQDKNCSQCSPPLCLMSVYSILLQQTSSFSLVSHLTWLLQFLSCLLLLWLTICYLPTFIVHLLSAYVHIFFFINKIFLTFITWPTMITFYLSMIWTGVFSLYSFPHASQLFSSLSWGSKYLNSKLQMAGYTDCHTTRWQTP